jgi:hypothetical protein
MILEYQVYLEIFDNSSHHREKKQQEKKQVVANYNFSVLRILGMFLATHKYTFTNGMRKRRRRRRRGESEQIR